jgi:hypothetical protein
LKSNWLALALWFASLGLAVGMPSAADIVAPALIAIPAGSCLLGKSPFGMLDAAGQVFEWTADRAGPGRVIVKGAGSWDDKGCGVCHPASRHTRPAGLKHILIGFRLVREVQ